MAVLLEVRVINAQIEMNLGGFSEWFLLFLCIFIV